MPPVFTDKGITAVVFLLHVVHTSEFDWLVFDDYASIGLVRLDGTRYVGQQTTIESLAVV